MSPIVRSPSEAYWDTQSKSFNLTASEININDQDKSKSGGVLYPAAHLIMNDEAQLQLDLNQNARRLSNIIGWRGTQGVN